MEALSQTARRLNATCFLRTHRVPVTIVHLSCTMPSCCVWGHLRNYTQILIDRDERRAHMSRPYDDVLEALGVISLSVHS